MPKSTKKPKKNSLPPADFSKIAPTINQYKQKLRHAQLQPLDSKTTLSRISLTWPITRLLHNCTRFVQQQNDEGELSPELFEWLKVQDYVDEKLLNKWGKRGYEKLCCLGCINRLGQGNGAVCVCRVPKVELLKRKNRKQLREQKGGNANGEQNDQNDQNDQGGEEDLEEESTDADKVDVECVTCGCRGCASTD